MSQYNKHYIISGQYKGKFGVIFFGLNESYFLNLLALQGTGHVAIVIRGIDKKDLPRLESWQFKDLKAVVKVERVDNSGLCKRTRSSKNCISGHIYSDIATFIKWDEESLKIISKAKLRDGEFAKREALRREGERRNSLVFERMTPEYKRSRNKNLAKKCDMLYRPFLELQRNFCSSGELTGKKKKSFLKRAKSLVEKSESCYESNMYLSSQAILIDYTRSFKENISKSNFQALYCIKSL